MKEAKRAEAQRKLALMQRLPSELKLRLAEREISLERAARGGNRPGPARMTNPEVAERRRFFVSLG